MPKRGFPLRLILVIGVLVIGAGLFFTGNLPFFGGSGSAAVVELFPTAGAKLVSGDGSVIVQIKSGSVDQRYQLRHAARPVDQLPSPMPQRFLTPVNLFDLTMLENGIPLSLPVEFNEPVTLIVKIDRTTWAELGTRPDATISILHFVEEEGKWELLRTQLDREEATAGAFVETLSTFTVTIRTEGVGTSADLIQQALSDEEGEPTPIAVSRGAEAFVEIEPTPNPIELSDIQVIVDPPEAGVVDVQGLAMPSGVSRKIETGSPS